ncbi:acriflavin resistance protein [Labrys okinawensis]|uniref:Acriflavin resistance protein n=2 Tax=Labrys TaxID=204476 RepID=A0A2S9Q5M6_9HYPH|nr:acriflavin resistance protein [Labrys okinawensis]
MNTTTNTVPAVAPGSARTGGGLAVLGMAPFVLFALLFLVVPTALLLVGAFFDREGHFTFGNITELFTNPAIVSSFWLSIKISFASALGGAFIGFFVAYAVILGGLPEWMRGAVMTFSGVASNFAGVPLAFAFLATLGRVGLVTVLLRDYLGFNLYSTGFNILSFTGLTLVYLYFQIPLMVLVIAPALDGLKREWREANAVLGGSNFHYWQHIALPILLPSILGATLLLFANAFGAVATAYALTGSSLPIIPIQLFAQIRGDVLSNPNLGYAIAFGMVVITSISSGAYIWLRSYSERWVR